MRGIVNLDPRITGGSRAIRLRLHLVVGRSSHGLWVVREQHGRCGGLFTTRAEALRFALQEAANGAGAVMIVPENVELFPAAEPKKLAS